jgi:hypothetical protein
VDLTGAVYATGRMSGTVDFDAGIGTATVSGDAFVLKLSTGGSLTWARAFTAGLTIEPHDIAVDADGNVYSTGLFVLAADFDPDTGKSQKFILDPGTDQNGTWNTGTYVSALNSSGNFLWAKATQMIGGTGYGARVDAMALDGAGGIYIAGEFAGTADFDPGAGVYSRTSAGDADAFIWKLDTSGNFDWAGLMGGTAADRARGIAADGTGNIYVAGGFFGTADFDPGASAFNLTSAGGGDCFVAKLVQSSSLFSSSTSLLSERSEPTGDATANEFAARTKTRTSTLAVDVAFDDLAEKLSDLLLVQI